MDSHILLNVFDQFSADHVVSNQNYFFQHLRSKLNFEIKNDSSNLSLNHLTYLTKSNLWKTKLLLNLL